MKLELKGLHKVRRRLAGGGERLHYYAWRGGPAIDAPFGTLEFAEEFRRLTSGREKPTHHAGTLTALLNDYQASPAFTDLAEATRSGYVRRLRKIEAEYGDLPEKALESPKIRGDFLGWRDRLAQTAGPREADYCFAVLARALSWAHDRRRILSNPCEKPGRLYRGSRLDSLWTDGEIDAFFTTAAEHVSLPFRIALQTGQREGDVLRLTWTAYDGAAIRLRQSKTGRHLTVPLTAELRQVLDAAKTRRTGLTICETTRGTRWTLDGYKTVFGRAKQAAGIKGRTFHDARGTAVVNLAVAGCSVPEICAITGHSLKDAEAILDRHYLSRDRRLAESAIAKLEQHKSGTKV